MTIFLSAFLLFQVQPLVGKAILPWFGGTPAVWMTCMLFFQVLLLGGYLYAHLLVSRVAPRWQGRVHLALLLASLALLPLAPSEAWKPRDAGDPTLRILLLLAASVGGPFLVLSATGPLLQAWFVRRSPGRAPWRLYALGNAGSLLALLSYPFVFEPALRLPTQLGLWTWAYAAFVLLCGGWAARMAFWTPAADAAAGAPAMQRVLPADAVAPAARTAAPPDALTLALWLLLSTCGSAMLLATTSQITQNVAPVPFLWVLPLGLYLLTFILCFDSARWYRRGVASWFLVAALGLLALLLVAGERLGPLGGIAAHALALVAACTACHGELAALRPAPRHLTAFYLLIAAGGALGGVLVTLLAPAVFDTLVEFPLALGGCCVAFLLARRRDTLRDALQRRFAGRPARLAVVAAGVALLAVAAVPGAGHAWRGYQRSRDVLQLSRNFYGVLQVGQTDAGDPPRRCRTLTHGSTLHGLQFTDAALRGQPTAYYGAGSGIAAGLDALRAALGRPLRLGVIGMGAGTLAAYARAGDELTFCEINPDVVAHARRWFTWWDDAVARGARLALLEGDARLVLERELADGAPRPYDLLAVDAFSSDAIPVHLLTAECFEVYRRRLAPDGLLAVHVSNLYLELAPVARQQAEALGLRARRVVGRADVQRAVFGSEWVLATADEALEQRLAHAVPAPDDWPLSGTDLLRWTDDFSSLFPLLR